MEDAMKQPPEATPTPPTEPTDAPTNEAPVTSEVPEATEATESPESPESPEAPAEDGGSAFFDYTGDMVALAPKATEDLDPNAGKNLALTSLILSLVALCGCGSLGFPLAIAAIVLAAISRMRARQWSSMSVAGLVIGILGTLYSLLAVLLIVFILFAEGLYYEDPYIYTDFTNGTLPQIVSLLWMK